MGINPSDVNDGFVKIVVDKDTNHILGMHVTGPSSLHPLPTLRKSYE